MFQARILPLLAALVLPLWSAPAWADDVPAPAASSPAATPSSLAQLLPKGWEPSYTLNGYVEAAYTYALEQPSNGIIHARAFDNRHNNFTLLNAVLDVAGKLGPVSARVALQAGNTPNAYTTVEPALAGASAANANEPSMWRVVQQAYAGYKAPVAGGLALDMGLFLTPVGIEGLAVKDNWNTSRSNLWFFLPVYHAGLRATLDVTDRTTILFMVTNGWNEAVDNNAGKSLISQITYKIPDRLLLSLLYLGGSERPTGAPEGQPWRHLVDGYVSAEVTPWLSLATHWDAGFERNRYGTTYWGGAALYARAHPASWLYLAARGDLLAEHRGTGPSGTASPILIPVPWVSSTTLTVDGRPHDNVSLRFEYRHDQASEALYFKGQVSGDGVTTPYVPNATAQNTFSLLATAWF